MINYIIYGNTDYLDVLEIQTDYMIGRGNLTLFLNTNELNLTELLSKYDKVIYYDGNDTYAKRLLTCLEQIDDEYFLLIHDIDVLLNVDNQMIENFYTFLKITGFDRIDLKHSDNKQSSLIIEYNPTKEPKKWEPKLVDEITDGIYLIKQDNPIDYIYNVNPSIWKKTALLDIVRTFPNKTYRSIEEMDVQQFCKKFKVFKINTINKILCGYFNCIEGFKFLHISHSGKLLPLNENFTTTYGQSYNDIGNEYIKIVDKYNLKNSNKWIR
jgi:hypothetical protein